jgi:hypothetical protein
MVPQDLALVAVNPHDAMPEPSKPKLSTLNPVPLHFSSSLETHVGLERGLGHCLNPKPYTRYYWFLAKAAVFRGT